MKTRYYILLLAAALLIGFYLMYRRTFIRVVNYNSQTGAIQYEAGYKGMRTGGIFYMAQKEVYSTAFMKEGDFTAVRVRAISNNQIELAFGTIVPDVAGQEGKGMFMQKTPVKYFVLDASKF